VISKFESDTKFAKIEQMNNVIGLLDKLKVMSHSNTVGVQNPYWATRDQLRKITAINQGKYESVSKFYEWFKGQADVITGHWGNFYPNKLAESTDNKKKKKSADVSKEKCLTMIFLARACKVRFSTLKTSLNNKYLAGKDNFPAKPCRPL
jgi:hypothetical protein